MTTSDGNDMAEAPQVRAAVQLPKRSVARYLVRRPSTFKGTWLDRGKTVYGSGTLLDISVRGFCARMANAPPRGRILHAAFSLENASGVSQKPVEAGARVCGLVRIVGETEAASSWIVNFAIEAIQPADEKLIARTIEGIKATR